MIALIDIGNTRTKFCLVNEGILGEIQVITNADFNNTFFTEHFSEIKRIVVASVNEQRYTQDLRTWCHENTISVKSVISEKNKSGITNAYELPERLGVDRWLSLIGAAERFPNKNVLIIDAGTATTVDLLAANGAHQGGWILAGINTLITSVLSGTSKVTANKEEVESIAFGFDTSTNVHNAAWAATIGAINLAIENAEQQGYKLDEIIFTGGNGALLSSLMSNQTRVIDELVFNGLQAYI